MPGAGAQPRTRHRYQKVERDERWHKHRARWLLADLETSPVLERLQARVSVMGRAIASEWAKDSDVRKINTTDLRAWGKLMEQGKERDEGTGTEIGQVIDAIESEYRQKMKLPAAKSP